MGEQKNPGDSTDFLVPQVKTPVGGWPIGSTMEAIAQARERIDSNVAAALAMEALLIRASRSEVSA